MGIVKRIVARVDPGFVIVLALIVLAVWPFLRNASLPEGTDAELHIFRLHELSHLLRGGAFYPRWAPNFYHGYGYPIFNYYAPLTYYTGFLFEVTPWFDPVTAVKATFILGFVLAGFGMYGFVRDNWGRRGAYVATAVFLLSPYVQYVDPHVRGVLPESFSFGMFAMALWALDRLRRQAGRWHWVAAVGFTAGVILSHNLMGLLFFGMLAAWGVWQALLVPQDGRRRATLLPVAGALFTGLLGAAIFWLPVIAERNAINLGTLIGEGDNYDFHTHFLSLRELFAPSLRLDWGATEPTFRFNLGVAQWLLGGLGAVFLLLRRVKHAAHAAFFAVATAVLLFLMLPASTAVWEALPFLPFFQFPWRLLGATAATLAVLAGAGTAGLLALPRVARAAAWVTAGLVLLPAVLALPLTQPAPWPDFGEVNDLRMTLIENTGRWLGTTSTADYVPATVAVLPQRKGSVVENFAEGLPPDRINHDMLPEGTTIKTEIVGPLTTRYVMETPRATRLRLFLFDFPGWKVRIDGAPVATELGEPEGFLVIPVPQGRHVVEVRFGSTPVRTLATLLSLLAVAITAVVAWRLPRRAADPAPGNGRDWPVLAVVLALLLLLGLFPTGWLHYDSNGSTVDVARTQTFANMGDQIALLGFDARRTVVEPGTAVPVVLYWKALRPLEINFQVFVHVLAPDGTLVAQSDKLNPGEFPTRRWPLDRYVRDEHVLRLPQDVAPGSYDVRAGLWVQSEGWRLPLFDAGGQQVGDSFHLFTLEVK